MELEKNHQFATNSDCEVIVHLYEETQNEREMSNYSFNLFLIYFPS